MTRKVEDRFFTNPGRLLLTGLLSIGLAACGNADHSDQGDQASIQSITVFGDSLSDVGTYQAATGKPDNPGKFTVNPGNVWVENIAARYGLTLKPNRSLTMDKDSSSGATTAVGTATVLGGNGYAEGGARVAQLPSQSAVGNNRLVAPVSQQVTSYLDAHGTFPANELVVIDGGSNDTYAQFDAICFGGDDNGIGAGNTTTEIATAAVVQAANDLIAQIRRIKDNGAHTVVVANVFDWGLSPSGKKYLAADYQASHCHVPVPATQLADWTTQFNTTLSQGVADIPGVLYVDIDAALSDAIANPSNYSFTNVTGPACTNTTPTASAVFCTTATLASPDAEQTYLFSDDAHPTPHGHGVMSDAALEKLSAVAKPAN